MACVLGHIVRFSGERLVFVGRKSDKPDNIYLGFRNGSGDVTRVVLSDEAASALARLLSSPEGGVERFPPDLENVWRVVQTIATDQER